MSTTTTTTTTQTKKRNVVTEAEWLEARKAFLAKEKAFTKQRDELAAARRDLPMVRVAKNYVFEELGGGTRSLADLFNGRPQLMIYHFMFDPSWEEGCKSCSYVADNFERSIPHFGGRDLSFAAISRAPLSKIEPFKKRMGWTFPWLSSEKCDFNYDFNVSFKPEQAGTAQYNYAKTDRLSESPGLSVFLRDEDNGDGGAIYHTYSTYGRGLDTLIGTYNYIDLTPLGRHEETLPYSMSWVRHRDKY